MGTRNFIKREAVPTVAGPSTRRHTAPHMLSQVRIAVLLHGNMGVLRHTLPSLQANLLTPLLTMAPQPH